MGVEPHRSLHELIEDAFRFLGDQGFRVAHKTESSVRYENDERGTFVWVFHDRNDKYLGFKVGQQAEPRDAITAAELDLIAGRTGTGGFPEGLSDMPRAVTDLARRLERRGRRALQGEQSMFDQVRDLRARHTQRYTRRPE